MLSSTDQQVLLNFDCSWNFLAIYPFTPDGNAPNSVECFDSGPGIIEFHEKHFGNCEFDTFYEFDGKSQLTNQN